MKDTKKALHWIVKLLTTNEIPFQILGGFAARAYGARRELADIDIEVTSVSFRKLCDLVKEHITQGPMIYKDDIMECEIVEFSYEGQLIEIVNAGNTVFRNPETNQWEQEIINFEDSELVEVLGISVPLIPKQQLIA